MDIQLDAPVVSSDGHELGKINRVVFDPNTSETKSLVIKEGGLLGRSVAAPLDVVRVAAPSRVELTWTKQEFDSTEDFVEDDYLWPPETWVAPYGWPGGYVLWPAGYMPGTPLTNYSTETPDEVEEIRRRRDENNAIVGHGADVVAMNGDKVGTVHNVMVDPDTHKPTRVIVKRGMLFTEDVELPGDWVASYDDQQVTLNVDKVTVEQLTKHQK